MGHCTCECVEQAFISTFLAGFGQGEDLSRADVIPQSSGLKQMARSVGRQSHPAIARQVMHNPKTKAICLTVLEDIQKDLSRVGSTKGGSSCL